jgi:predicted metal-dependent HD superfamily phosphohydrolase
MNELQEQVLSSARAYVTNIFAHEVKPELVFHNLEHTEDVVEACSIIADHYHLEDDDRFVLMLAAWFHDTGYSSGQAQGHEEVSIRHATAFLHHKEVDETVVQRVNSCIQATKMPQSPVTQVEKILCDADLYHLATDDFLAKNALLKEERENLVGHKIPKKEWRKNNISFLKSHKYFTDYGQETLEPKKHENLLVLQKKKPKKEETIEATEAFPYVYDDEAANVDPKDVKNAERGVQTMFRTTSHNHLELSSMADSKAHIMISVNSIIISVSLSFLIARLAHYPHFIIPTAILMAACLCSVIFAILSTRPSISKGQFTEDDIRNKKTNLLFFGNFYSMQLQDYQWGMNQMIKDKDYLYNTMIMDIYYLGVVLARKYKFLRIAYTVFMWGLILSVIAFAAAAVISYSSTASATQTTTVIDY